MTKETKDLINRRGLLMRMGLAAGAVYVAPTLAGLDVARASTGSGGGSSASSPSSPSSPSGPSSPSRPDRSKRSDDSKTKSRAEKWRWRWDAEGKRWVRVKV